MKLARINPARSWFNLDSDMNRMLDRFFSPDFFDTGMVEDGQWLPSMDVVEEDKQYLVQLEIPGATKSDVKITYVDGRLMVEGERKREKEEKNTQYHRIERSYGKFRRAFELPKDIKNDSIEANFKNGVLTITLPKLETVQPKQIEVKVS